jgi:hypothetical protein
VKDKIICCVQGEIWAGARSMLRAKQKWQAQQQGKEAARRAGDEKEREGGQAVQYHHSQQQQMKQQQCVWAPYRAASTSQHLLVQRVW